MNLIGNTPIIKIRYKYKDKIKYIYSKLEWYNLSGSIKDRVVKYIIDKNIKNETIKKDTILVEATSGNTGISLSAIGAFYKHKVVIFIPDFVSKERIQLMKLYGADVKLISRADGGFKKCLENAYKYSQENNAFLLNQFSNIDNINAHYETTSKEITDKINNIGGFVSGVGSGGTIMGIAKRLKEINPNTLITALEPLESPMITYNISGIHKIEGIGDDFIPEIFNKKIIDRIALIESDDAIKMAQMLSKIGLGVGITSGANMLGSILLNEETNNVVTIFPDDSKKYLTTDLTKEIPFNKNFISNNIELIDYEII